MDFLKDFFVNPSWLGLLAIVATLVYFYLRDRMQAKVRKKDKHESAEKEKTAAKKQEFYYQTIDRNTDAIEQLIANNTNKVSLMQAEEIITKTLLASKGTIEREVRDIFKNNHRESPKRQEIIRKKLINITVKAFESDTKMLLSLHYKDKNLAEFLINIKQEKFFKELLRLVFSTGGVMENELSDVITYLDNEFEMFILQGKKFYNRQ